MRTAFAPILLLLAVSGPARANDGAFYASGDTIHPTKETRVALRREVLTIARHGDWIHVDVQFEFENPDPEPHTVKTGFVTPFPFGDVSADDKGIRDFTVVMNGRPLEYRLDKHVVGSSLDLPEGSYSYLFDADFKPGRNLVHHTYEIRAGTSVEIRYDLEYTLKTARSWANGRIDDFTLRIEVDGPDVVGLPSHLFPGGRFEILGVGRERKSAAQILGQRYQLFAIKQGTLELRATNFVPKKDLHVVWVPPFFGGMAAMEILYPDILGMLNRVSENKASARDRRLLRNAFYAKHGRVFRDPALKAWFGKQFWYFPDPAATDAQIEKKIDSSEQRVLSDIAAQGKVQ